ncbi:unnamed protein product [Phytomonas sp. Hart1]|nr:unnamed protein product [Phytomonas sp. Hart1]|eukprot:CCW71806.1 unnamed protein product [Phytomonas sp. isolate Hart1]
MQPHSLSNESASYGNNGIVSGDEVIPPQFDPTVPHASNTSYRIYPFQPSFTPFPGGLPEGGGEGRYPICGGLHPTEATLEGPVRPDRPILDNEEENDGQAGWRQGGLEGLRFSASVVGWPRQDPLSVLTGVDPVTMALRRRRQQEQNGEPATPLSPRTLQAAMRAAAGVGFGMSENPLHHLTVDDVLAPVPLALTWYPTPAPHTILHGDRKRQDEEGPEEGPMRKKHRVQAADEVMASLPQPGNPPGVMGCFPDGNFAGAVQSETAQPPVPCGLPLFTPTNNELELEQSAPVQQLSLIGRGSAEDGAQGNRAGMTGKRQRDENVFEFVTRGPRFH